eukprot:TRINITY_DN18765_c1_g1_i1.p2 TRINITY_DN18765_c1_g1~~TRINITY_DN18765_c1_g1_i1.p2  ORF type:complete len:190 (+),score=57.94 TRINITY_DN18765_c1_g1_i1:41-610(+)
MPAIGQGEGPGAMAEGPAPAAAAHRRQSGTATPRSQQGSPVPAPAAERASPQPGGERPRGSPPPTPPAAAAQRREQEAQAQCSAKVARAFGLLSELLVGEVQVYEEDLKLLSGINSVLARRYGAMTHRAEELQEALATVHRDYRAMQPHFAEVDALDVALAELEDVVNRLDGYSRRLEQRLSAPPEGPA